MKFLLFSIAAFYSAISLADTSKILVTELSDEVFILTSSDYGTNIGLINTGREIVLVDPMPGKENLDALDHAIKELFNDPVKYILNTHEHRDHSGGNNYFTDKGSIVLDSASSLTEIEEMIASSHTPKDRIFFHKGSNSIFVGDIYDTSWHPTFYAGGLSGFNNAVETILNLGDEKSIIVPGHGKTTSKRELRVFRENTFDWVSKVKELKEKGITVSEIGNNEQIKSILKKFNTENKDNFIPEKSFLRFIERTLKVIEEGA